LIVPPLIEPTRSLILLLDAINRLVEIVNDEVQLCFASMGMHVRDMNSSLLGSSSATTRKNYG
jgi:hypothetical protein